ncbi:F-box only protein 7 [Osmerus mordax]|uniref:F-box only protein 7 n=1 Tax=Osmerus mordax TaxID=8014 RepID=UPI00350F532E
MKLRVRVNKQTSRVELEGEEPTITELSIQIKEILLPSHGLSPDTEFTLSLNGTEPLCDTGQTLSSCSIVSGDLICVILPQSVAVPSASPSPVSQAASHSGRTCPSSSSAAAQTPPPKQTKHSHAMHSNEPGTSSKVAEMQTDPKQDMAPEEEQEAEAAPLTLEPMLCDEAEEGKLPHSLDVLHHNSQSGSPFDAVMVVVHLLMLETGFFPQGSEVKHGEMPSDWRAAGGVYRLKYTHPFCEDSLILVVAVPMGNLLAVNASLKINEKVEKVNKLTLNPVLYVNGIVQREDAAASTYKDLRKLSRVFKDKMAYPVIAAAREAMALPPVFGLSILPPELLLRMLRLLDVGSLLALSSVSRHLNTATADSTLWRHFYRRDFRDSQNPVRNTDWKQLYKTKYKIHKEASRYRPMPRVLPFPRTFPFHPGAFHPIPPPLYPPGIIGGEYDERPNLPHGLLPRPRYDPIGPLPGLPGHDPAGGLLIGRRGHRPSGGRPADIRRGFI